MKEKNILLVGDLRTGFNYGAVATTEALMKLIQDAAPDSELRAIDSRSFTGNTPVDGWPPIDYNTFFAERSFVREKVVTFTKRIGIYNILKTIQGTMNGEIDGIKGIPARIDMYDNAAQAVCQGQKWQFEKKQIEWADIVIINSEGNIVNGTDAEGYYRNGGRYVLFFAYLSKCIFQKTCYIINHTVDPKNRDIIKIISTIYPKMDGIYVREKMSGKLLQNIGVSKFRYVPDALWSYDFKGDTFVKAPDCLKNFDFTQPFICLGDSSGIYNKYSHVKWDIVAVYTRLIEALKKICPNIIFVEGYSGGNQEISDMIRKNKVPYVSLRRCSYHELYYVLSKAQLFISGRWHASIIALLGHTPILLWGADSHKTEALYGEIDYPYEFFDVAALPLNIDRIVNEAQKVMQGDHAQVWEKVEWLKKEALCNVDML